MQLVSGQKPSLQVGDLPRVVAEHLGCHPAIVYLGHEEVLKIVRKHPKIRVEELQCLPFAIAKGEYREDPERGKCVTVFYNEPTKNKLYLIGLKSACAGGEVGFSPSIGLRRKTVEANGERTNCFALVKFRRASLGKRRPSFLFAKGPPGNPSLHPCLPQAMLRLGEFHRVARKAAQPLTWRRAANHSTPHPSPESPFFTPVFSEAVDKLAACRRCPSTRNRHALHH
jgi:hypothetical protein